MQPISINVQIQVGVTDQLYKLLAPLANLPAGTRKAQIPAKEDKPEPAKEPEVINQPQAQAVQEEAAPAADPQPEPASAPAPEPEQREYTEVDVRAAMDEARKRIEGEDYKTNTESEGRKKWHRALTGWFKNTAALYGAEKPSELPDSESRGKFIRLCAEVKVENDELTTDIPF